MQHRAVNSGPEAGSPSANDSCHTECNSHPEDKAAAFCRTDKVTVSACDVYCGTVPDKDLFPGACQADGSPAAGAPAAPTDGEEVCDYVNINGAWEAVECAAKLDVAITAVVAAPMVPTGGATAPAPADPAAAVDHRSRFGAAKNQAQVGSCTAFATTACIEAALASRGRRDALSDQALWLSYCQPSMESALEAARKGVATLAKADGAGFPYDGDVGTGKAKACEDAKTPNAAAVAALAPLIDYVVASVDPVPVADGAKAATTEQLVKILDEGRDIVAAVSLHAAEWQSGAGGTTGIIPDAAVSGPGGHAVLLIGYKQLNGKTYFIFRNSWGNDWGDKGYGYMSADYVQSHALSTWFTVNTTCQTCLATIPSCAPGQAASSDDGLCRKVCPNGSLADAAGTCPPPPACPAGHVSDASQSCVLACAVSNGLTYGDGITGTCKEGGCTYAIPKGIVGCTTDGGCTLSCEAPSCGLGTTTNEFGVARPACTR